MSIKALASVWYFGGTQVGMLSRKVNQRVRCGYFFKKKNKMLAVNCHKEC